MVSATALLTAGFRFSRNVLLMFSVNFSQLLAFEHVFYPLDLAKGESLYLTQIKLDNDDATTFVGRRNVCNDFVEVGFPSFDFSGPRLNVRTTSYQKCLLSLTYAK